MNIIRPTTLSKSAIQIIQATAAAVAPKAEEITTRFYENMFRNNPEVLSFFNKANNTTKKQPRALAHAVVAYANNIDNLGVLGSAINAMAVKHCGLQVLPQHYSIVEDNLMLTIGEVLGDAVTEEVASGWKEAVQFLSGTLINVEENLYSEAEKRQGGWRGWKQFLVKEHEKIADGTVLVTLAADNLPIDFSPGQFLTIRANDVEAPRHYTIVSSPGEKFLQIAVKQVEGGAMSTFIHNDLKQGSTLEVSPPFGNFVASANKDSVLISGGIGITTMVAFQKSLGDKVKKIIHVDQSSEKHAFLTLQQGVNCDKKFFYSKTDRRPNIESIVNEAIVVGPDTNIYICGPGTFMHDIKNMLNEKGATNVSYEAFGPQLSH